MRNSRPDIESEMDELQRASQDLMRDENIDISVSEMVDAFKRSKEETLTNNIWSRLENTESNQIDQGDWSTLMDLAKRYKKTNPRLLKRSIEDGTYKRPLILKIKNRYILVAGNTRLSTAAVMGVNPLVFIADVKPNVKEEDIPYDPESDKDDVFPTGNSDWRKKVTNEVNIQKKTPVGSGAYHTVFPFEKFKDKIIKTKSKNISLNPDGSYNVVKDQGEPLDQDEMKIFQANPDLFAKVYKVTDRYAVIERLETKQILRDIDKYIGNAIVRMIIRNPTLGRRLTMKKPNDLTGQDFDGAAIMNLFRNDKGIIKGILKNTSNKDFVIKFMSFINNCYNSIPGKKEIDIQERNVGYDKSGNIKLLDF